jgi:hypothetical protein
MTTIDESCRQMTADKSPGPGNQDVLWRLIVWLSFHGLQHLRPLAWIAQCSQP